MLQTYELLDRFELLYPTKSKLADLRRAYNDKDLSSIFRLLPSNVNGELEDLRKAVLENNLHSIFRLAENENLRKLILEDNTWKLWPLLDSYVDTQFVTAFKSFFVNDTVIDTDCFSRGQLESKLWLIRELKKLDVDLGTVFLCAGWYATLATMIFESGIKVDKIRSFDIDSTCIDIAKTFNKPWVMKDWQFQASTQNILDIDYHTHKYAVSRADGTFCELIDSPDTVINTSCEHIKNFEEWYNKIPMSKLVILQTNNYFEIEEHVNCVNNLEEFMEQSPMTVPLFEGELQLSKYTRYMRIGYK